MINYKISFFWTVWAFGYYKVAHNFQLFIGPAVITMWK